MKRPRKDDLRIDELKIEWLADDLDSRVALSCTAVATVSYKLATGDRRLEWFRSGGLFGIDVKSDQAYLNELATEQLDDLRLHLRHFAIEPTDHVWNMLVIQSPSANVAHGSGVL